MTRISNIDTAALGAVLTARLTGGNALALRDFPEFPLALNVEMPDEVDFELGNVGMAFHQFRLKAAGQIEIARTDAEALEVAFPRLTLTGVYRLAAKKTVRVDLDTGGSMLDLPDDDLSGGAAAGGDQPLDPEQSAAMLEQARDQRTKLRETPNGQALIDTFNEHNEIYNSVFVTNEAVRTNWRASGATQEMAVHTSDAVKNDATVNSATATYGSKKVTYNGNAFTQQLNITVGTIMMEGNPFSPKFKPDPNSKYTKAALAALTFGNGVNQTGNDKAKVNELTASGVFSHVETGTKPPEATMDQLNNALAQSMTEGGAAAAEAEARNWRVLDEEDRAYVRRLVYEIGRERAEKEAARPVSLWSGGCSSTIDGVTALLAVGGPAGAPRLEATVTLPAFMVDLDDSRWTGPAVATVRERLRDMYFVRRMLQEGIKAGLRRMLEEAAAAAVAAR